MCATTEARAMSSDDPCTDQGGAAPSAPPTPPVPPSTRGSAPTRRVAATAPRYPGKRLLEVPRLLHLFHPVPGNLHLQDG
jgi:hypothetical protein